MNKNECSSQDDKYAEIFKAVLSTQEVESDICSSTELNAVEISNKRMKKPECEKSMGVNNTRKKYKETTKDRLLEWNYLYSNVQFGIWIQCTKCNKWRKSTDYEEEHEVPEDWHCSMSKLDPNNCDDPEDTEGVQFSPVKFIPGSIVWAKLDGYPWWPGMIEDDPDTEEYYWIEENIHYYNVTFLDEKVKHAWVQSTFVCSFLNSPYPTEIHKMKNKKLFAKYAELIETAVKRAQVAITMPIKERLENFSFAYQYSGKWPLAENYDSDYTEDLAEMLIKEVEDIESIQTDSDADSTNTEVLQNKETCYTSNSLENNKDNANPEQKTQDMSYINSDGHSKGIAIVKREKYTSKEFQKMKLHNKKPIFKGKKISQNLKNFINTLDSYNKTIKLKKYSLFNKKIKNIPKDNNTIFKLGDKTNFSNKNSSDFNKEKLNTNSDKDVYKFRSNKNNFQDPTYKDKQIFTNFNTKITENGISSLKDITANLKHNTVQNSYKFKNKTPILKKKCKEKEIVKKKKKNLKKESETMLQPKKTLKTDNAKEEKEFKIQQKLRKESKKKQIAISKNFKNINICQMQTCTDIISNEPNSKVAFKPPMKENEKTNKQDAEIDIDSSNLEIKCEKTDIESLFTINMNESNTIDKNKTSNDIELVMENKDSSNKDALGIKSSSLPNIISPYFSDQNKNNETINKKNKLKQDKKKLDTRNTEGNKTKMAYITKSVKSKKCIKTKQAILKEVNYENKQNHNRNKQILNALENKLKNSNTIKWNFNHTTNAKMDDNFNISDPEILEEYVEKTIKDNPTENINFYIINESKMQKSNSIPHLKTVEKKNGSPFQPKFKEKDNKNIVKRNGKISIKIDNSICQSSEEIQVNEEILIDKQCNTFINKNGGLNYTKENSDDKLKIYSNSTSDIKIEEVNLKPLKSKDDFDFDTGNTGKNFENSHSVNGFSLLPNLNEDQSENEDSDPFETE